jgi:hypothetical protein
MNQPPKHSQQQHGTTSVAPLVGVVAGSESKIHPNVATDGQLGVAEQAMYDAWLIRDREARMQREAAAAAQPQLSARDQMLAELDRARAASIAKCDAAEQDKSAAGGQRADHDVCPPCGVPANPPAARIAPSPARERDDSGLGAFSQARRRQAGQLKNHARAPLLNPQLIYRSMQQMRGRPGGDVIVGKFTRLLRDESWHPTDTAALRCWALLTFGLAFSKPRDWNPQASRRRTKGPTRLADIGPGRFNLCMAGVGQGFLVKLLAAGDDEDTARKTVWHASDRLERYGLMVFWQPGKDAKVADFERSNTGERRPFNQYWFPMCGQSSRPNLRGPWDDIDVETWAAEIDSWLASLREWSRPRPKPRAADAPS